MTLFLLMQKKPKFSRTFLVLLLVRTITIVAACTCYQFAYGQRVLDETNVYGALNKFCEIGFQGVEDPDQWVKVVKLTEPRRAQLSRIMGSINPMMFELKATPLTVVESYKIVASTTRDSTATAVVEYKRIAERSKWSGRIVPVNERKDQITLHLQYLDGQWWVIDPPSIRVSRAALLTAYEQDINGLRRDWINGASVEQIRSLKDELQDVITLRSTP